MNVSVRLDGPTVVLALATADVNASARLGPDDADKLVVALADMARIARAVAVAVAAQPYEALPLLPSP